MPYGEGSRLCWQVPPVRPSAPRHQELAMQETTAIPSSGPLWQPSWPPGEEES